MSSEQDGSGEPGEQATESAEPQSPASEPEAQPQPQPEHWPQVETPAVAVDDHDDRDSVEGRPSEEAEGAEGADADQDAAQPDLGDDLAEPATALLQGESAASAASGEACADIIRGASERSDERRPGIIKAPRPPQPPRPSGALGRAAARPTPGPKRVPASSAAKLATPSAASRKAVPMMRINQQPMLHQESFGEGIKTGPSGSDNDSDSEISDAEHFLAKGAFLLTPSHELSLEKASAICEKMNFSAPFSLTKTATGILFKFARPEDYQATFKKGFHKVTGARFYKKIPIPCRPQKTFTVFVLEVPEEVPEEDIRHALYKFHSVVEVVRLAGTGGPQQLTLQKDSAPGGPPPPKVEKAVGSTASGSTMELGTAGPPPLVRVTLANLDEYHVLLQNGLDFYGATFFPTEAASPSGLVRLPGAAGARKPAGNRILDVVTASGQRVRDLLPVFDSAGFSKIPPPAMKTIKPRPN